MTKYQVIMADPPWPTGCTSRTKRKGNLGSLQHYELMSLEAIVGLREMVLNEADPEGSFLFLWTVNNQLPNALRVMNAWGYTYKTNLVWDKYSPRVGYYTRNAHELLLLGVRGSPAYLRSGILTPGRHAPSSIIREKRRGHSQKPIAAYGVAEGYAPDGNWLEMFARYNHPGWDVWGYEAPR